MKRKFGLILVLMVVMAIVCSTATAGQWGFIGLTGGVKPNLDYWKTADIANGDTAAGLDTTENVWRVYQYDSTSSDAESVPDIIKPDDNTGNGRWLLKDTTTAEILGGAEILTEIKKVDGSGSGLDADMLDGHEATYFATDTDLDTHVADTANPHGVTKSQVGLGNVENLKVNLNASAAPTATDDSTAGYSVGSRWVDTTNDKEYVCLDATASAAVWTETTQDTSTQVTASSTFGDDNRLLRSDGTGRGAQASPITVDDSGNMSGVGTFSSGGGGFTVDDDGDVTAKSYTAQRSPVPTQTMGDSDTTDSDDNWKMYINATDTGSGTEDIDLTEQLQINGTLVNVRAVDASEGTLTVGSTSLKVGSYISISEVSTATTLTAAQCHGGVIFVTAAVTVTLPAVEDGASVTIIADGANAVTVAPNAADGIKIDGSWKSDGTSIASDGTDGAMVTLIYRSSQGWFAAEDGNWS